ncbi:uncharacterized protein JCM6883_001982 [Sporobolomyces salmoneus]|uniref:uncharacterized protein n=1 Tax=Sporobolomyces salmoneus TaxID=183962 RepID=UPI00316BE5C8
MSSPPRPEPVDSDRAIKRRRTSSPASSSSRTLHSQSPPRATTQDDEVKQSNDKGKGKGKSRAERLAGFDDEEEEEIPQPIAAVEGQHDEEGVNGEIDHDELCAICLAPIDNKTVIYPCHHGQFCWNCIRAWTDQSRKCPLCLGPIEHLIHNIRSTKDYSTYHLLPLHTLQSSGSSTSITPSSSRPRRPLSTSASLPRHALYGRQAIQTLDSPTPRERLEEIALERRKYIYREGLYAKHVASNRYTGFKPFSPQTFSLNSELKAKVIKFIRRELQVFPAVDISFLTTYLISIASQLDLRSPAALRLVSDFLSESDAQHLVHEIVTFARSPFTSLEGYDRFIQYGRPEKRAELEKMVFETEELVAESGKKEEEKGEREEAPRFARNMVDRREEEENRVRERRYSNVSRGGGGRPRSRSRSRSPFPPPPPRSPPRDNYRRNSFARGDGRNGFGGKMKEPDWRDRDERYTGSYYRHSQSRMDRGKGFNDRDRGDERRARRNSGRKEKRESFGTRDRGYQPRGRGRSYSRSPSPPPGYDYDRRPRRSRQDEPRSISRDRRRRHSLSRSRSRSRSRPRSRSPSPFLSTNQARRSRSPTPTRLNSEAQRTPTPPPQPPAHANDSEYQDVISLSAPALSPMPQSPTRQSESISQIATNGERVDDSAPAIGGGGASRTKASTFKPTLSIFGAARRTLLGNGNTLTFSNEGKIELQVAGTSKASNGAAKSSEVNRDGGDEREKAKDTVSRSPAKKEKRILEDRYQPVAAPPSLLSRMGPALSAPLPPSPDLSSPDSTANASSITPSTVASKLKAKLQERLTAEYRQALSQLSSSAKASSTAVTNGNEAKKAGKVDLRALLQSRLQAEKALAYDSAQRRSSTSSSAAVAASDQSTSLHSLVSFHSSPSRTTFSQATKDLLLMRLEEERLLAQEQNERYESSRLHSNSVHVNSFYSPPVVKASLAPTLLPSSSSPSTALTTTPSKSTNESDLKAKLLEKRKVAVEQELKKRSGELKEKLMRDKLLKQKQLIAEKKKLESG